ncbi:MAG: CDP-alcohol phosphatidyltransferase family protein, partial [Leptospirales bacterium]|nr:CDP-alcohol phosphatidyltransferase family protein [Leptospirales bacterium]
REREREREREMLYTLKEIKKTQKKPDGIFGSFMTRPVSHIFAYFCYKLSLTPNFVTFLSLVFCSIGIIILYIYPENYNFILLAAAMWWIGGIFDAADGDLAKFTNIGSLFGGWFDSFLDRIKEFLFFGLIGYLMYKRYDNEIYLLAGFISIFTNVMSGYISDSKKIFTQERTPEIKFSENYSLGMVDTRDFIVILSLILNEFRIALIVCSTLFMLALIFQLYRFVKRYA